MFSCQKEKEEVLYSCDPELNEWAHSTMARNSGISRDSLAVMDLDTQFAIFRSLPNEDKLRLFNEKIDLVISTESLTTQEKVHLQSVTTFMDPAYYKDENISILDSFFNEWAIYAMDSLGWDSTRMGWTLETWLTETEVSSLLAARVGVGGGDVSAGKPCECKYNWYCGGPFTGNCEKGNCDVKRGCGWLGYADCKGRCKPEP